MLFADLFRAVLADVPAHLDGIGSGALTTRQQSGLALGVATQGTLFLVLQPYSYPHAFAAVEDIQMGSSYSSRSARRPCRASPGRTRTPR